MDVVTLGMLIIVRAELTYLKDEIHFQPPREPEIDILGGAGSWAVVGARFFRTSPSSKRIGWTVHKGSDFPMRAEDEIQSWDTGCHFIDTPERLTTRGWNSYGDNEERAFSYMTEKLRIDETQLTPQMLASRCFHLICTPTRCVSLVRGILARRKTLGKEYLDSDLAPIFVWEPVPDSMGHGELQNVKDALQYVDVVSPNHQELAALLRHEAGDGKDLQTQCSMLIGETLKKRDCAVVVRCGERGCYVATAGKHVMMPAYHNDAGRVTDPTGAGNSFLGGLCIGLVEPPPAGKSQIECGAAYGSVAASFAVEQVGLPHLSFAHNGKELWNSESVEDRLRAYWSMIGVE